MSINSGKARSPNEIKDMLLRWSRAKTRGYEVSGGLFDWNCIHYHCHITPICCIVQGVNVENFSGSWADGLAFCALIHHFFPDSFDFSQLDPNNRKENLALAFKTIEYAPSFMICC